eukprot:15483676-Alexandrium_andersonii.AAC.1
MCLFESFSRCKAHQLRLANACAERHKHVGEVGATRFESVRWRRHYGRVTPWKGRPPPQQLTMTEDDVARHLGAPQSGAPSRSARALSPIARLRPCVGWLRGGPNEPRWRGSAL